jgi:hypothetical protein
MPLQIPFEKQQTNWSCGAAALCMVYRSFGVECVQSEVWREIAGKSALGWACSRAQALASDAIKRGFSALALQVRDPWLVLERCTEQSVAAIINHVPTPSAGSGHFSVLTALSANSVVMHDPSFGPSRSVSRSEFLQIWNPRARLTEILDQVMVAISDVPSRLDTCPLCRCDASDEATCKSCKRSVRIQPLAILGCLTDWCPMRAWEQIFCPWCNSYWTKGLGQQSQ